MTQRLRVFRSFLQPMAFAATVLAGVSGYAQTASAPSPGEQHSTSYYHYGLAHLYESMAVEGGRSDYSTQAIEQYKLALQADPQSPFLQNGLANLYLKLNRVPEAMSSAQDRIKANPDDLAAHELLGKIYLRSLGDNNPSQQMVTLAIGEFEKIAQLKPKDVETRLLLGQLYTMNHETAKAVEQFKAAQAIEPNSEDVILNMARLYTQQGDLQHAVQVLTSIPQDDRSPRVELALGSTYDDMKKFKDAAAAYQRALDQDPDELDIERALGTSLLYDEQLDAAFKVFTKVVAAEPKDAPSQIHLAEIQRRQGHYEDALTTLKKAKLLVTDSLELDYNEALTYDALGQYDNAEKVLNTIVAAGAHADGKYSDGEKANRGIFLNRLGILYREQGQTDKAVATYKQLESLGGDYVSGAIDGEVEALRDAHQWKQATDVAAEAAKAYPKDHGIQLLYASQLADNGKVDDGLALANAQITGGAEDRDTYLSIAQMNIRLKRWDGASAAIDKAAPLANKPNEKWYVEFVRGMNLDRQKRYDESEAAFRKALEYDPESPATLNYLGYQMADRGVKLDESLKLLRKAVELDPQNAAYLDSLGWAYYKLGQYDLAEQNLRKANERDSNDPTMHDHLGEIYAKQNKLQLAVAQWDISLKEYATSLGADAETADVEKVQKKYDAARVKLAKVAPVKQPGSVKQPVTAK